VDADPHADEVVLKPSTPREAATSHRPRAACSAAAHDVERHAVEYV